MSALKITEKDKQLLINVKVIPGSSKSALCGTLDNMLKVKIAAAAEKGKANKQLIELLSDKTGLSKKDVEIVSGKTSPIKQVAFYKIKRQNLAAELDV
jgi:hypothetical protein